MAAIERDNLKIYIVDSGTAASDLADSDVYKGSITNYDQSGGTQELETTNAFGGDIRRTTPRDEIELSMDVTPSYSNETSDYASLFMGEDTTNSGFYTSALQAPEKDIYIEAEDGNGNYVTHGFQNARAINFEPSHSADDTRELSITFNLPPTTEDGKPNYATTDDQASNFPDWSTFDSV